MEEDWLVKDKYCKGCMYYGRLSYAGSDRCCDYTYITGKVRYNPPCDCEVKKKGRRPSQSTGTGYLLAHKGRKNGGEKSGV